MAPRESEFLSTQQIKVMALICRFEEKNGRTPLIRELAQSLSVVPSSIQYTIGQLTKKGYIRRKERCSALEILKRVDQDQSRDIPVYGVINGTVPFLFQKPINYFRLNSNAFQKEHIFAVKVDRWSLRITRASATAESMAIFHQRQIPSPGNIVLAWHNGTLKLGQIHYSSASKIVLQDGLGQDDAVNIKPTDALSIWAIYLTSFSKSGAEYFCPN